MSALSLSARVGVALHLFANYCRCRGIDHFEVGRYIEHMWGFLALPGAGVGFEEWEADTPDLVDVGLGDELPDGLATYLAERVVSESEFRTALMHCTEILYGSMFAAADNAGSLRDLTSLAAIVVPAGAAWPDLSVFASSLWDRGGWGGKLTANELAAWRAAV